MNGPEIRKKIDENNTEINKLLNKFVLTNEIKKYLNENQKLRDICPHEFSNEICIYCDLPKEYLKDD